MPEVNLSKLNRNAAWMLLGTGTRLGVQGLYFILMARSLGPKQYGMAVAVTATVAIISPFIGNGCGSLMIKHVAQDRTQFAASLGTLLIVTFLSGLLLCALVAPACLVLFSRRIPPVAILMVVISDVLVFPYAGVAGVAFWSLEKLGWTSALNVFSSLMRLIGIAVIIILHRPTLMAWTISYLVTSTVASAIALSCVLLLLGAPRLRRRGYMGELREGFYFAMSLSAQTIYNDIDKTMLARLSTLEATGYYGVAYRLIDVAFQPVSALLSAAYPGFFRHGNNDIRAAMQYGRRLLTRALPYSFCACAILLISAPGIPRVLGHEYAEVTRAVRWLAVLPILKTLHYFVADSLTGAGHQGLRTLVQLGVAAFNVMLNLWVIPLYGWRGAAWSSIASDTLLWLTLWLAANLLARRAHLRSHQAAVAETAPV